MRSAPHRIGDRMKRSENVQMMGQVGASPSSCLVGRRCFLLVLLDFRWVRDLDQDAGGTCGAQGDKGAGGPGGQTGR